MNLYFDTASADRFTPFAAAHLTVLFLIFACGVLLYTCRHWLKQSRIRRNTVRYLLLGFLVLSEVSLNVWYVRYNVFDVKDTLPLELCSISLYVCIFMLLFRNRVLFQIAYFAGIGGALQALLTPVLWYGFPHFRFFEFFIAHAAIILSVLYMVWVEQLRPTWRSIGITMVFVNAAALAAGAVNALTGANYMFLARKPASASMLDLLGPHPWYIISMEAAAVVLFVLLYLPFALADRRKHSIAGKAL